MTPGLYIEQPTPDAAVPFGEVPEYLDKPIFMDGVVITVRDRLKQSREDFWITRYGVITPEGKTQMRAELDHGITGLSGLPSKLQFAAPVRLKLGEIVFVQFVMRGVPGLLKGVSIIPRLSLRGRR